MKLTGILLVLFSIFIQSFASIIKADPKGRCMPILSSKGLKLDTICPEEIKSITGEKDCNLKPKSSSCYSNHQSFFFNTTSGNCERFTYGGCGKNEYFETKTKCNNWCKPKKNDKCVYNGQEFYRYQKFKLDTNKSRPCVTVTCSSPPEFTFEMKDCEFKPSTNQICLATTKPGECCPKYTCKSSTGCTKTPCEHFKNQCGNGKVCSNVLLQRFTQGTCKFQAYCVDEDLCKNFKCPLNHKRITGIIGSKFKPICEDNFCTAEPLCDQKDSGLLHFGSPNGNCPFCEKKY